MKEVMIKMHPTPVGNNVVAFNNVFDCGALAYKMSNNSDAQQDTPATAFKAVNQSLFNRYVQEFPCLKNCTIDLNAVDDFRNSLMDDEDDDNTSKELAVDCILELLSGGDYQITWKDIFDVFSKEDQNAFLRIMSFHANAS